MIDEHKAIHNIHTKDPLSEYDENLDYSTIRPIIVIEDDESNDNQNEKSLTRMLFTPIAIGSSVLMMIVLLVFGMIIFLKL